MYIKKSLFIFLLVFAAGSLLAVAGQNVGGDGSTAQRLEVLRQKLETIRKSAVSAASVLEKEDKASKADKKNVDTPLGRLRGVEKDASRLLLR